MYVNRFEMLFDILPISPKGPNSQVKNFGNWEFLGGRKSIPFLYETGGYVSPLSLFVCLLTGLFENY